MYHRGNAPWNGVCLGDLVFLTHFLVDGMVCPLESHTSSIHNSSLSNEN